MPATEPDPLRKPDETDADAERRLRALAAAAGVGVEDLRAECDTVAAVINYGSGVSVWEQAARQWVLLEVTALAARVAETVSNGAGVLAAWARGSRTLRARLIDNAMPVAVAEFDRTNKFIDHLDGDAWAAARVGVAAALASEIDTAIEHIPQMAAKEQRRQAHDTALGA